MVKAIPHFKQQDGKVVIYLYVFVNGKNVYHSLDIAIHASQWDQRKQLIKLNYANSALLNKKIVDEKSRLEKLILQFPDKSAKEIKAIFSAKEEKSEFSLIEFADKFLSECKAGKQLRSPSTVKNYSSQVVAIRNFISTGNSFDFSDLNKETYDNFVSWLRNKGVNENTTGSHIKFVKMICNEANERGIYKGNEHKKKYFKKPSQTTDPIYLNKEEIEKIISLDLSTMPEYERERDRFIVQYYLLLRHSDTISITEANFSKKNKKIYFTTETQKTENKVVIPVKPLIYEICKKHKFNFSSDTNQESNKKLKVIARMAGITEMLKVGKEILPKCKFVSTHTARYSSATNLYMDKILPEQTIMHLGGWKDVKVFRQYIKVDKLQSAEMASGVEFFS